MKSVPSGALFAFFSLFTLHSRYVIIYSENENYLTDNGGTKMGGAIAGAVISIVCGIVCLVIGILNMRGNVSMMHSYHVNNISPENIRPFGRLVGIGMIITAVTLAIYGALFIPAEITKDSIYTIIANVILVVGLVIGLGISLYAIKKYNKKIIG